MEFSSFLWACPFLGIVFSMSFFPLLFPNFWHKYASCVPLFWSLIYLVFVAYFFGVFQIFNAVCEPLLEDYLPFIILIAALYAVSGGIFVDFPRANGPIFNALFLLFGSVLAGWIGTTGASTLLIRPFLRANAGRKKCSHLVVFFIFLVANIGGSATPIGDPPLFIGFLKGIDFFWFIKHLYPVIFGATFALIALFLVIDSILFKNDPAKDRNRGAESAFILRGKINLLLMAAILLIVIFCNFSGEISLYGHRFSYSSIIRNGSLVIIALISLRITPKEIHKRNGFSVAPIREVAELFAGIFVTVAPIISMLQQGADGTFGNVFRWMAPSGEFIANRCFWASGLLSSLLDNAPTFLIFFHLTSGDAQALMTVKSHILATFSISTVFMGALTYLGNAPNLMVRSIAKHYSIKTPSFLGYLLWSCAILLPIFAVISAYL
ncbi:MAG: sodium:proton antiporter [Holosporaceae bacterium]|jgi:Na+/H+ antiporter NhaD/arsenite permease-like protein|nr:sodium:proton antiporter [Holosporaceae bacterium]